MGARLPEEHRLAPPPCPLNRTSNDSSSAGGACLSALEPRSFSSALVLVLVAALIFCLLVLSIVTFHIHKSRMKRRKIQRAQEEYERDHRSPGQAERAGFPQGPRMLLGRSSRDCAPSPAAQRSGQADPGPGENSCGDLAGGGSPHSVVLS
ncbi:uncharacterized protein C11orf87 homolog isoform X2 [Ambystoma mexicanum]